MYDTYAMYEQTKALRFKIDDFIRKSKFMWFSRQVREALGGDEEYMAYIFASYARSVVNYIPGDRMSDRIADAGWWNLERIPASSSTSFDAAMPIASEVEKEALAWLACLVEALNKIDVSD